MGGSGRNDLEVELGIALRIAGKLRFALDLVLPKSIAPLAKASWLMDIIFVLCAAGLGYLSWITFKEQP